MLVSSRNAAIYAREALEGVETVETLLDAIDSQFDGHMPDHARKQMTTIQTAMSAVRRAAERQTATQKDPIVLDPILAGWMGQVDIFVIELQKALHPRR